MRVLRTLIFAGLLAVGLATPAAAQSTTTMPPVRSIPVTPAPTTTAAPTTTTTARTTPTTAAVSGESAAAPGMADTGIAADKLVPLAFLLIALGALLDGAARRYRRTAYSFL